jgi:hypothetical protein
MLAEANVDEFKREGLVWKRCLGIAAAWYRSRHLLGQNFGNIDLRCCEIIDASGDQQALQLGIVLQKLHAPGPENRNQHQRHGN